MISLTRMARTSALAAMLVFSLAATAQERTAGSSMETQMTWTALSGQVKTALDTSKAVNSRVDQIAECGRLGMVYAPGHAKANGQGCLNAVPVLPNCPANMVLTSNGTSFSCKVPASPITIPNCPADQIVTANGSQFVCTKPVPPSAMKLVDVENTLCSRTGNHNVAVSCPAGKSLLSCSGGPGDQDESHEYWVLESDYRNNRCIGHVGAPRCYGSYWSQTIVKATCY